MLTTFTTALPGSTATTTAGPPACQMYFQWDPVNNATGTCFRDCGVPGCLALMSCVEDPYVETVDLGVGQAERSYTITWSSCAGVEGPTAWNDAGEVEVQYMMNFPLDLPGMATCRLVTEGDECFETGYCVEVEACNVQAGEGVYSYIQNLSCVDLDATVCGDLADASDCDASTSAGCCMCSGGTQEKLTDVVDREHGCEEPFVAIDSAERCLAYLRRHTMYYYDYMEVTAAWGGTPSSDTGSTSYPPGCYYRESDDETTVFYHDGNFLAADDSIALCERWVDMCESDWWMGCPAAGVNTSAEFKEACSDHDTFHSCCDCHAFVQDELECDAGEFLCQGSVDGGGFAFCAVGGDESACIDQGPCGYRVYPNQTDDEFPMCAFTCELANEEAGSNADCTATGAFEAYGVLRCYEGCAYSNDGYCDDGGDNAEYDLCAYGSDCADCGGRYITNGTDYDDDDYYHGWSDCDAGQFACYPPYVVDYDDAIAPGELEWYFSDKGDYDDDHDDDYDYDYDYDFSNYICLDNHTYFSSDFAAHCCDPVVHQTCFWDGWPYCELLGTSCPESCDMNEVSCYVPTYDDDCMEESYELQCQTYTSSWTESCERTCGPCEITCDHDYYDATECYPSQWYASCPVSCGWDEQTCTQYSFDTDGYVDYNAGVSETCVPWNSSCPCNEQYEEQCTSEQSSWCQPLAYGGCPCEGDQTWCYSTGYTNGEPDWAVGYTTCVDNGVPCECDADNEIVCGPYDDGMSWCQWTGYGGCPVYCGVDESHCSTYGYDATGYPMWDQVTTTCAAAGETCTCDPTYEEVCSAGEPGEQVYSWCEPIAYGGCPCDVGYRKCYENNYDSDGNIFYPEDATAYAHSCVSESEPCPCNQQYETLCGSDEWAYCLPNNEAEWCPYKCGEGEQECWPTTYNADGTPDWSVEVTSVCVADTGPCPCDATFETLCTDNWGSWCQANIWPCPVVCADGEQNCWRNQYDESGDFVMIGTGWNAYPAWEEYCAVECTCDEVNEYSCDTSWGYTDCLAKNYNSGCPVVCADDEYWCYEDSWDTNGWYVGNLYCSASECTVSCGDNSNQCGTSEYSYCIWDGEACPVVCSEQEKLCILDEYDAAGNWVSYTEECHNPQTRCPCGDGARDLACVYEYEGDSWEYCIPEAETCPVTCTSLQKYCYSYSFDSNGDTDGEAVVTCTDPNAPCTCGTNARRCTWVEHLSGATHEYCQAESINGVDNPCPVVCLDGQDYCSYWDYSLSGEPQTWQETCVAAGEHCPCGVNSRHCETGGYCIPSVDPRSGLPTNCPIVCGASEEKVFIPNFDASGEVVSSVEVCQSVGAAPDCSLGSNGFGCLKQYIDWDGSQVQYTECLPLGTRCPVLCTGGQVACDPVVNFDSSGNFLSQTAVADEALCQASVASCPCGQNAKRCNQQLNGKTHTFCIPSGEACPLQCGETERLCDIIEYDDVTGLKTGENQQCLAATASCPCGTGATKCVADNTCYRNTVYHTLCQCSSTEKQCLVTHYDMYGLSDSLETVCVPITEQQCPCGNQAQVCTGVNAGVRSCKPTGSLDGLGGSCPSPCTAVQKSEGKETCTQTNYKNGNVTSEVVTCVDAGQCQPGVGQKKCPGTGAMVRVGGECVDYYGVSGGRRLQSSAIGSDVEETSIDRWTITMNDGYSQSYVATVKGSLDSVLQFPSTLNTELVSQDLDGSTAQLTYTVKNSGQSTVRPSQVASNLKNMLEYGNPDVEAAIQPLGLFDPADGVTISTTTREVAVLGGTVAPTPAPSPTAPPTVMPTTFADSGAIVSGDFALTVGSANSFVAEHDGSPAVAAALQQAISTTVLTGVSGATVDTTVSASDVSRRLGVKRRLQEEIVTVMYDIITTRGNADAVVASATSSLSASASASALSSFQTELESELAGTSSTATISGVAGGTAPTTVYEVTPAPTIATPGASPTSTPTDGSATAGSTTTTLAELEGNEESGVCPKSPVQLWVLAMAVCLSF